MTDLNGKKIAIIATDRFEESEGKRIFLEFADEEREHFDLLVREYRALVAREKRRRRPRAGERKRSA